MDNILKKPDFRPHNVCFGSGPCAKHEGWTPPTGRLAGRSHRSKDGLNFIQKTLDLQREILGIPADYKVAFIDGSATAAMEMLIWNLIGEKPVDIINHCVFSNHWCNDIVKELKIQDANVIRGDFPNMADTSLVNFDHDVVFCVSSTTSGVAFKNLNWIPSNRDGLTIADTASAVYCLDIDWSKIDATAFSWQKGLGSEGGSGVIVLSPRAMERLKCFNPNRAIPRILRLKNDGIINEAVFDGSTINTPSLLAMEDYHNALLWARNQGGLAGLLSSIEKNRSAVSEWINHQNLFSYLVDEKYRAPHIACLDINDARYNSLSEQDKWNFLRNIVALCEENNAGCDFLGHIMTHPHLRIWCGPTVNHSDLELLLPWIDFATKTLIEKL